MSKIDTLIETLAKAANEITPTNGGVDPLPAYFDSTAALVAVSYRIGRALTLARAVKRESN